jgi:hypothetical protein
MARWQKGRRYGHPSQPPGHAMSLRHGQRHQLRRIALSLRRSDPHLGGMFAIFGRLYAHQDLPAWEQTAGRTRSAVTRRARGAPVSG